MRRIRLVITPNPDDPADDLRVAAFVRRDLYAHSPVEIDPDNPAHATHRDEDGNAYFDFSTDLVEEVQRVLEEFQYSERVSMKQVAGAAGEPCVNCGHVEGGSVPATCPNCGFRDASSCPHCNRSVPREDYVGVVGDLLRCPHCQGFVRLVFNEPLLTPNGDYNQPLVLVEKADEIVS